MENSIEEDIKIVENYLAHSAINETDSDFFKNGGWETVDLEIPKSMQHILFAYKRVLKENECLKNHIHYKNCIACGKEFRSKRDDAKYCIKCSKQVANKNYIANLTEEQKLKRREQAKLAMRKLRANRK